MQNIYSFFVNQKAPRIVCVSEDETLVNSPGMADEQMDRILNHRAAPLLYQAYKDKMPISMMALIYNTTETVIRAMLRRTLKKIANGGQP